MSVWDKLRARLARRGAREEELQRELDAHLQLEAEEQRESGLGDKDARAAARRALGNALLVQDDVRATWSFAWLEAFARDVKYGARALRKSPGFAIVAILTLALGFGSTPASFRVVDALMLRPLPFTDADRIVRIYSVQGGMTNTFGNPDGPSAPDVRDFEQRGHSLEKTVVYDSWRKNVSFGETAMQPEETFVGLVPAAYFEVLNIHPIVGRLFAAEENQTGRNFVAAISAQIWKNRYASDPDILGRKIRINGEPYAIVAVMPDVIPAWVEPGRPVEIWTPFPFPEAWLESARGDRGYAVLARLKAGVSVERAQADLSAVAASLAKEHPEDDSVRVVVKQLADTRIGALRPMLYLLMGAVSLILLIACVNLANLLLARNSARQRELAVRTALGASRAGLVRQLFAETLLLSLIGAAVGLLLAKIGLLGVMKLHPADLPQLDSIGIDWRVLTFTLAVSLGTSLLFGLAPALTGTRVNLVDALKQGRRSGSLSKSGKRMRSVLVATEMAMSLMLLVAASLLVQSILRLEHQSLGIRADHLLKGHLYLPPVRYPDSGAITRFADNFGDRVRALPGVIDATVTTVYPPDNGWVQMLGMAEHPATRIQDVPLAQFGVVDAHFLNTMGIPLLRGRDFAASDSETSPRVALISEEFRRRYFPSEDAVGKVIHIGPPAFLRLPEGENTSDAADVSIVGIIGDIKNHGLARPADPQITVLYAQHPLVNYGFKDIVVRTAAEPRLLTPVIAEQLHELDPDLPFAEVRTMDELVAQETNGERFTTVLLSSFAIAGLALAVVGIYGVIAYLVAQRAHELAVRMALGANRANVLWLVVRQGVGVAAIGAAIGLCGSWATQKLTSGLLFGVSPVDLVTYAGGALFLVAVAAIATAIPGAGVLRIDPARSLRQD